MFNSDKIKSLEYEVNDLKQKYYDLSFKLDLLIHTLGYEIERVQPMTVLRKKEKAG